LITRTKLSFFILLIGIVAGIGLRINAISRKSTLSHDESISYLSATGHQGEYSFITSKKIKPYGQWSSASEWKRFILPEKRFCFNKIGSDLARYDIHPPLYFWMLHLWSLLFGVHLWTGPSLNLLFVLVTTFFLFSLAKFIF